MAFAYPQLTRFLEEAGTGGYLIDGEDSNQYYFSGFPGSSVTLYTDRAVRLLVPDLEYTRDIRRFERTSRPRMASQPAPVTASDSMSTNDPSSAGVAESYGPATL